MQNMSPKTKRYFFAPEFNEYTEKYEYYQYNSPPSVAETFHPLPFKPYYVSNEENTTIVFDDNMKRWISKDHLSQL